MNKWKPLIAFPLAVSFALFLVTGILAAVVFLTEINLAITSFDRILTFTLVIITAFLSIKWLAILVFESFDLSFGKLYTKAKWLLFFIYYPISRVLGFLLGFSKEDIQTSFLTFQNRMFLSSSKLSSQSRVLMLLPHCLQYHDCKIRITRDINSCEDCGECDICNLKDIGKKFEIKIGIANGGTLARKIVNDIKPDAIIAVACHRDLTDGVRESWKFPVFAVLNERPFGPCFDTKVDIDKIEDILKLIFT